jgi:Flp pilus assembly protein TadG
MIARIALALLCALFAAGCSVTAKARLSRAGEAAVRVGEAVAVRVIEDEIQRLIAD